MESTEKQNTIAESTVFNTTELRELIFSHLSVEDALQAARTCRTWQDTLSTPIMQVLLFYQPDTSANLGLQYFKHDERNADADEELHGSTYNVTFTQGLGNLGEYGKLPPVIVKLHPLLDCYCNKSCRRGVEVTMEIRTLVALGEMLGKSQDAFICQSPVTMAIVELLAARNVLEARGVLTVAEGVRFRHVLDYVRGNVTGFVEEELLDTEEVSKEAGEDPDDSDHRNHLVKVAQAMHGGLFCWSTDFDQVPRLQKVRVCIEDHVAKSSRWVELARKRVKNTEA